MPAPLTLNQNKQAVERSIVMIGERLDAAINDQIKNERESYYIRRSSFQKLFGLHIARAEDLAAD